MKKSTDTFSHTETWTKSRNLSSRWRVCMKLYNLSTSITLIHSLIAFGDPLSRFVSYKGKQKVQQPQQLSACGPSTDTIFCKIIFWDSRDELLWNFSIFGGLLRNFFVIFLNIFINLFSDWIFWWQIFLISAKLKKKSLDTAKNTIFWGYRKDEKNVTGNWRKKSFAFYEIALPLFLHFLSFRGTIKGFLNVN